VNPDAEEHPVSALRDLTVRPTASGADDLERLFRQHHRGVFAAAYRVTGNAMDAEDVLQTVFARLAGREDGPGLRPDAGPYLRRAAVNAALDVVRSRGRRPDVPLALADAASDEDDRAAEHAALRSWLRGALADLEPRAAEVFALRYLEGFANTDIARLLGTTPSSIGVILHRARLRLRDALERSDASMRERGGSR
jgi:RNA polymerase sigma-70 factor, ECF subfamily